MLYSMSSKEIDTRTRILETTWHLMEKYHGKNLSMGDIAKSTGISRQAVYLHFTSRTELLIATSHYVDEVKGLDKRLKQIKAATTGIERLEESIEVWGNYIPEIYGLAKALQNIRQTDEAAAAAWNGNMKGLLEVCREIINALNSEGKLASEWVPNEAVEMFWTMISINNWEQLTHECGLSTREYIDRMKVVLKRTFVK